jgi:acetyltransferase-like isoleucine patch superfamily enzyme
VVSGFCDIGPSAFVGVNATFGNNLTVGADCLIGAGAVVVKDVAADTLVRGNLSDLGKAVSARRFFKVAEAA